MHRTVISDASCFIVLHKIHRLELLQQTFEVVITTSTIASEFGLPLPEWVLIRDPVSRAQEAELSKRVDRGEATAIALALELGSATLIVDDQKARRLAEHLGIQVTGTVGLLVRAKLEGNIETLQLVIDDLRRTNFRITEAVEREALRTAGELDEG